VLLAAALASVTDVTYTPGSTSLFSSEMVENGVVKPQNVTFASAGLGLRLAVLPVENEA
jgi:hypothetical protein